MRKKKKRCRCMGPVFQGSTYKITAQDEKIIRRYILILSRADDIDYYIGIMAYIYRTTAEKIKDILAGISSEELASIESMRKKWEKRGREEN